MKAIRKSDGKVIEVKEIYPIGDEYIPFVQYYETEDGTICQDTDLDFSVGETKEAEGDLRISVAKLREVLMEVLMDMAMPTNEYRPEPTIARTVDEIINQVKQSI